MASSIELVKKLRAMTHAPLKDCKSAIEESAGDLDRAQEILREKGALKAAKKADRETNEGVVVVKQDGSTTVGVKIACETDFVAKNDTFLTLASDVADMFA
jgi:elongation factor Ts